jgi:hypothetical protein
MTKKIYFMLKLILTFILPLKMYCQTNLSKNQFLIKEMDPLMDNFEMSYNTVPHTFPWVKIRYNHELKKNNHKYYVYSHSDNYIVVISLENDLNDIDKNLLRKGFALDVWSIQDKRHLGRFNALPLGMSRYEAEKNDKLKEFAFYEEFKFDESHVSFDLKENKVYLPFYRYYDKFRKKNALYIPCKLESALTFNKKFLNSIDEEKSIKIADSQMKFGLIHQHLSHKEEGKNEKIVRTSSVNQFNQIGITSLVYIDQSIVDLVIAKPNDNVYNFTKFMQDVPSLIQYIESANDPNYIAKAKKYLLKILSNKSSRDFQLVYDKFPNLRDSLEKIIIKRCEDRDENMCRLLNLRYPKSKFNNASEKIIENEEILSAISKVRVSDINLEGGTNIIDDNQKEALHIRSIIFDKVTSTKGTLKYLISAKVNNPSSKTITFLSEAKINIVQMEEAKAFGFFANRGVKQASIIEEIIVQDLKPNESRNILFCFDLGYQEIERSLTLLSALETQKYFEITKKEVLIKPIKRAAREIELLILKNIKNESIAQIAIPNKKISNTLSHLNLFLKSSHYSEIKEKAFIKSKELADEEVSKELISKYTFLNGKWVGKYMFKDLLEFDVELSVYVMDDNNVDAYAKYTLVHSACPSMAPLYGKSYFNEFFGVIKNNSIIFKHNRPTMDRFNIWYSASACRTLDLNKGVLGDNIEGIYDDIHLSFSEDKVSLKESITDGKKFKMNLRKEIKSDPKAFLNYYLNAVEVENKNFYHPELNLMKSYTTKDYTMLGLMMIVREDKNTEQYLPVLMDPFHTTTLIVGQNRHRLKYYSGITIVDSEISHPFFRTNLVNCEECGARYRYFELYFEPVDKNIQTLDLDIGSWNFNYKYNLGLLKSEFQGLFDTNSDDMIIGYEMDINRSMSPNTKVPNCKCFHPATQQLVDVWASSSLTCKNGLVNGLNGVVNYTNGTMFSSDWVNGKANGQSSFQSRMHPLEKKNLLQSDLFEFENNVVKTITDKTLGWQFRTLINAYATAYVALYGTTDGMFSSLEKKNIEEEGHYSILEGDCHVEATEYDNIYITIVDGGDAITGSNVDAESYVATYKKNNYKKPKSSKDPFKDSSMDVIGILSSDDDLPIEVSVSYKKSGYSKMKSCSVVILKRGRFEINLD